MKGSNSKNSFGVNERPLFIIGNRTQSSISFTQSLRIENIIMKTSAKISLAVIFLAAVNAIKQ